MDILPSELSDFLRKSEAFIDADGELGSARRKEMHILIEKLSIREHRDAGYYRRAKLEIACAYFSLDFLKIYNQTFNAAKNILEKSILTLQGQFDIKALESLNGHLYTDSENLIDQNNPNFKAIYASFACFSATNVVLYDVDFEVFGLNEKQSDPSDWEAGYYSSLAHSGGAIWEDNGDAEKRKEFWLWYLRSAVPYAWDTSKPFGPVE